MEAFPAASVGPWLDSGILNSFAFCHFVFISGSKRLFSLAVFCKYSLCKFKLLTCPDGGPSVNMQQYCWSVFPDNNKDCFPRIMLLEFSLLGRKHPSHNTHVCGRDPAPASWSPSSLEACYRVPVLSGWERPGLEGTPTEAAPTLNFRKYP